MLVYRSGIDLSSSTVRFLAGQLRSRHRQQGTRWRRLPPGRQALLVLAHLRKGDTYAQLAAGFGIGTATAYRYVREAIDALAALAPTLQQAMDEARRKAFLVLDGTLLPIDRIAEDRPYYSGKHKRHGMNVQDIADPHAKLLWASPALPGATHNLTTARTTGIIEALGTTGLTTWADHAYQAAERHIRSDPRPETQAVAASLQHNPCQDPLRRRTGRRHTEGLASPPQDPMQYQPDHRPCPSRPHTSSGQLNARMKCAQGPYPFLREEAAAWLADHPRYFEAPPPD